MENRKQTCVCGRSDAIRCSLLAFAMIVTLSAFLAVISGCDGNKDVTFPPRPTDELDTWFFDIWGASADNIWIVGQPGLILHWDGQNWSKEQLQTKQPLISIYGNAANDIYVCGHKGTILHFNGSSWSSMNSGTKQNLMGIGMYRDGRIYCVGEDWTILRLDGGNWNAAPKLIVRRNVEGTAILDTLKRDEGDQLFLSTVNYYGLGGKDGMILMEDTQADWQIKLVANQEWVTACWSDPDVTDNYLATDEGRFYRLRQDNNRLSWGEQVNRPTFSTIYDMWTAEGDTFYFATQGGDVAIRTSDGYTETVYEGSLMLYGIWGTDSNNIYAVGIGATVLHYQDGTWEVLDLGLDLKRGIQPVTDKFGRLLH